MTQSFPHVVPIFKITIFRDFFPFVLFGSRGEPIKNITAPYQVMSLNPNVVYICLPYRNLGSKGDREDSDGLCLVH